MPFTIDQLQQEHNEFLRLNPDRQVDLKTFAQSADELYGTPGERSVGYNWGPVQQFSTGVDRIVKPVSKVTGSAGRSIGEHFDKMFDSGDRIASTLEGVGAGLPRFAGEAALTAVPAAGPLRAVGLLAKGLGYASAYARGSSEHEGSVAGGLVEAGTLGLGNVLLPKVDKAIVGAVNKRLYAKLGEKLEGAAGDGAVELARVVGEQTAVQAVKANVARTGARLVGGEAAGAGLGEVNRQAQITVDGGSLEERNPFTLENIVGNAAGAVGFAPITAIHGLRRPSVDLDRAAKISEWAVETGRVKFEGNGDIPLPKQAPRRINPAAESFRSALDQYIDGKKTGDGTIMDDAVTKMRAAEKVKGVPTVEFMAAADDLYNDVVARGVLPSDLKGFVQSVNDLIDAKNRTVSEDTFFERESEPTGPSSTAIKQLQDKGYLPKIDEAWLKQSFEKHLKRSLNEDPQFAYKGMVTEVANKLLDMSDDAKERMAADATIESTKQHPTDRAADRQNQTEKSYIESLAKVQQLAQEGVIPKEVVDELISRHIEIANRTSNSREGIEGSGFASWREAVIEAVENFDASTGKTILTFGNKKKGELVTRDIQFEDLVRKNNSGQYVINPKFRRFRKSEGGRSTKEISDVGFSEESQTPSDIAQAQIYEDYGDTPVQWTEDGVNRGEEGEAVPVEDNIPAGAVIEATTTPENQVATKLRETIDTMGSEKLFKNLEPWMRPGRKVADVERNRTIVREAFNAVIELRGERSYLSKESIDFAKKMLGNYDTVVAKSGEREAVRVAAETYWASTLKGMWKAFRREEMPTGLKKYEVLIERILGPESLEQLKVQRHGTDEIVKQSEGLVTDKDPQSARDFDIGKAYQRFFRNQGYEAPLADHFASIAVRMSRAYNDVKFRFSRLSPDDPHAFYQQEMDRTLATMRTAGVYSQAFMGRYGYQENPLIAIALEHSKGDKDPFTSAFMLSVLSHEIIHGVEAAAKGNTGAMSGPYQAQRVENYKKMLAISTSMTPLERYDLLTTLAEATFPEQHLIKDGVIRPDLDRFLKAAVASPEETVNLYGQFLSLGKISPNMMPVKEWLKWQPDEVQAFTQGLYRDLSDQAAALSDNLNDPNIAGKLRVFHEAANGMLQIPSVQAAKTYAAIIVSNLSGYPERFETTTKFGVWNEHQDGGFTFTSPKFMAAAEQLELAGLGQAKDFFWKEKDGVRIGKLSYLMPFFQLLDKLQRRGVTLAGDVWKTLADVQPGYNRLQTRMLDPLLLRTPDGKLVFDNDNPYLKVTMGSQRDPKARLTRAALNEILKWQQDNDSILAVTRGPDGSLVASREAAHFLQKRLESVPVEWRQTLLGAVDASNQIYARAKDVLFQSQVSKSSYRIARLIQTLKPTEPYNVTHGTAQNIINTALQAVQDVTNPNITPAQKFAQLIGTIDPVIANAATRYLFEGDGVATRLVELKKLLDSRPGFASEQRPGRFLVESVSKNGKREIDGADSQRHAEVIQKRLITRGSKIVQVVDKNDIARMTNFDAPDTVYEKAVAAEQANWEGFLGRMEGVFSVEQLGVLKDEYVPGEKLAKEMAVRGVGKFTAERKFVGGRDRLDYVDATRGYVQSLAGSVARAETRNTMRLIMDDARLDKEVDFKARALQQLDWVMTPDSELATRVKTGLAGYYLGGNLSSMLIEGTQSAVTLVPQLLAQGGRGYGLGSAWRTVAGAAAEAWGLGSKESFGVYTIAAHKIRTGVKLTPTEERTYWFRKALDDGILDHGAIQDVYDRDQRALMAKKLGHGDYGDASLSSMIGNKVYQAAQLLLWAYGKMSNFNQKVAFAAGLKQGQELKLTGEKLYEHARKTKDLSMFGGGKANQPAFLANISNPSTKSTLGVMYTLQQYGLGMTAHLFERANDSFGSNSKLSPLQRTQARKAFGTMAATQLSLAGALGLPFVGAALAVAEKVFGINANAAVREGLASLAGDDEELGGLISELALDGIASHTLGVDVGSRVGVSNLLGTSAYRGFSFQDMLGPAPSVIGNMVNAVGEMSRGNMWEGTRQLVPAAFKNALGIKASQSKFGDLAFRDRSSNLLYEPTTKEAALYAIGFRPRELAQKQRLQGLLKTSDDLYAKSNDTQLDTIARALRTGDSSALVKHLDDQRSLNPMFDEKSLVASVINRAVNMDVPVDPLASGPVGNQAARRRIAGTFDPSIVDRRDETSKAILADSLNAQTGYRGGAPMSARELMKASMLDSFVGQGMTRTQALRQLEMMRL